MKEHKVDCISTELYTENPCSCGTTPKAAAMDTIPDRKNPRSIALWIMAKWQTTCEPHLGRHDKAFKECLTDLITMEISSLLSAEKERDELKANRQYETDLITTLRCEKEEAMEIIKGLLNSEPLSGKEVSDARAFLANKG